MQKETPRQDRSQGIPPGYRPSGITGADRFPPQQGGAAPRLHPNQSECLDRRAPVHTDTAHVQAIFGVDGPVAAQDEDPRIEFFRDADEGDQEPALPAFTTRNAGVGAELSGGVVQSACARECLCSP